jgi:hypothetical protein
VGQQSVAAGDVQHASAATPASDPPRHFPRLVELLARQPADAAHHAADAIEQRLPGKPAAVVLGQPATRAWSKAHPLMVSGRRAFIV